MQNGRVNGKFAPGVSGNPRGRPRTGHALAEAIQRMVVPADMVNFALKRVTDPAFAEKDRQWAVEWLSRQGFKLPAQVLEVSQVDVDAAFDVSKLSDTELDAMIAGDADTAFADESTEVDP